MAREILKTISLSEIEPSNNWLRVNDPLGVIPINPLQVTCEYNALSVDNDDGLWQYNSVQSIMHLVDG